MRIFLKYREIIVYGFFGGLTTLINFVTYAVCDRLGAKTTSAITAAWVLSVAFAYAANRIWVFNSQKKGAKNVLREVSSFVMMRAGTYFLDLGIVWFFVDNLGYDSRFHKYTVKLLSNILVVIVNYLISKFIVFRRKT